MVVDHEYFIFDYETSTSTTSASGVPPYVDHVSSTGRKFHLCYYTPTNRGNPYFTMWFIMCASPLCLFQTFSQWVNNMFSSSHSSCFIISIFSLEEKMNHPLSQPELVVVEAPIPAKDDIRNLYQILGYIYKSNGRRGVVLAAVTMYRLIVIL